MLCSFLAQSVFSWATLSWNSRVFKKASCVVLLNLHFTICLEMIGTGDVMSNVGQLIEFLTDLKYKL